MGWVSVGVRGRVVLSWRTWIYPSIHLFLGASRSIPNDLILVFWGGGNRYYRIFAFAYAYALSRADGIVANGTWTKQNIDYLLYRYSHPPSPSPSSKKTDGDSLTDDEEGTNNEEEGGEGGNNEEEGATILYPPCDTEALQKLPLVNRKRIILSVAQFRWVYAFLAPLLNFWSGALTIP